jgi:CoA:oxalate CoA-transferase
VVPGSVLSAVVACAGADRWLAVEAVDGGDWERLCRVLELRPTADPSAADVEAARTALAEWATTRTPYQAAHLLQRAGVAAAPVQDASDLARDPQLRARQFIVEIDHPDLGRIEYPGAVERTVQPSGGVKGPVPRLGEHTRQVLAEWAGIGEPEVAALVEGGAIWLPEQ